MFHKKTKHLGLQLDMASQRCLVADCGFWFATSALAPLASRRGKNWKSECRPDMIRVIENHRFQTFFFDPWRAKSSHRAGETQISTLESHACQSKWMSMLQAFFDDSCKYQHFVSYPQKSEFQIRHPYKGAESTGCLVYTSKLSQKVASWSLNSTPAISSYLSEVNHGWTMAAPRLQQLLQSFRAPLWLRLQRLHGNSRQRAEIGAQLSAERSAERVELGNVLKKRFGKIACNCSTCAKICISNWWLSHPRLQKYENQIGSSSQLWK